MQTPYLDHPGCTVCGTPEGEYVERHKYLELQKAAQNLLSSLDQPNKSLEFKLLESLLNGTGIHNEEKVLMLTKYMEQVMFESGITCPECSETLEPDMDKCICGWINPLVEEGLV